MVTEARPPSARSRSRRMLPLAWLSFVLFPLSFALAFVVGEGMSQLLGVDQEAGLLPWWAVTLTLLAAVVVFASPLLVTTFFSNRAAAQHERGARIPLVLGGSLIGAFVAVNLVSGLLVIVLG